jgi:eukaryotic-like serine/threonine-protein kinase
LSAPQGRDSSPSQARRAPGQPDLTLFEKPSSGALPEKVLRRPEPGKQMFPMDWSRDGRMILVQQYESSQGPDQSDLWVVPLSADEKPFPYLATSFSEGEPALSPDGRWLAYVSNESGSAQVIVQPFPDPSGGKWQISAKGGHYPRWRRDGREIYYLDPDRQIVAVSVTTERKFEVGKSTTLFTAPFPFPTSSAADAMQIPYDVTADGQRFFVSAVLPTPATSTQTPITVITNWMSTVRR